MLVLSRKRGESIVLDGDIKVTIVKISGNKVRLGIEAPADVAIKRTELKPQSVALTTPIDDEVPAEFVCSIV